MNPGLRLAVRATALATIGVSAVAVPASEAQATTSGTCGPSITAIGVDSAGYGYTHSKISCNNAKTVKLVTKLYSYEFGKWVLDGNHSSQTLTWSSVNGTKTGSATAVQEFTCRMRATADVYWVKGGVTTSRQALKDYTGC